MIEGSGGPCLLSEAIIAMGSMGKFLKNKIYVFLPNSWSHTSNAKSFKIK